MFGLFKKSANKDVLIEEIHETFNVAGDKLLASALEIINKGDGAKIEKADRLVKAGFKQSNEVKKWEAVKVTKELADLIQYYQMNYPNNKFITESQVYEICNKYNLCCGPVERYKGFVPDIKLKQIEGFHLNLKDIAIQTIKITSAWNTGVSDYVMRGRGAKEIHRQLGLEFIPVDHPSLYWMNGKLFSANKGYVEQYKVYGNSSDNMLICAPAKDMNLKGLEKVGAIFQSFTTVTVPDPVVLQPVKGGFLIVCAWGDESSDEIVVNEKMN